MRNIVENGVIMIFNQGFHNYSTVNLWIFRILYKIYFQIAGLMK